jgi:hypothetical protein
MSKTKLCWGVLGVHEMKGSISENENKEFKKLRCPYDVIEN